MLKSAISGYASVSVCLTWNIPSKASSLWLLSAFLLVTCNNNSLVISCQTPVIALVGNDACWSQISREQVPMLGSNVACGLAFTGAVQSFVYMSMLMFPIISKSYDPQKNFIKLSSSLPREYIVY